MRSAFPESDKCWRKMLNSRNKTCASNNGIQVGTQGVRVFSSFTGQYCQCMPPADGNGYDCTTPCPDYDMTNPNCAPQACFIKESDKSKYCGCINGYESMKGRCTRTTNYCDTCRFNCHVAQKCVNSDDIYGGDKGYTCTACDRDMGFQNSYSGGEAWCTNFDECAAGTHNCSESAECKDSDPGLVISWGIKYTCTCKTGYRGEGTKCSPCQDINECEETPGICGANSKCTNTPGSYYCKCLDGYTTATTSAITFSSGGHQDCVDYNECAMMAQPCKVNSQCNNTVGSWTCKCNTGFIGDGKTIGCSPNPAICNEKDTTVSEHCNSKSTDCILNSAQTAWECICKTNYTRFNKTHCTPRTYCDKPAEIRCAPKPLSICTDKPDGSGYTCQCSPGYNDVGTEADAGKGYNCEDSNPCYKEPCKYVAGTKCKFLYDQQYECVCLPEFVRQKADFGNNTALCYPINGPQTNNCTQCRSNSEICIPTPGDPNKGSLKECTCRDGYRRPTGPPASDGTRQVQDGSCVNINECAEQLDNCDRQRAECIDLTPEVDNNFAKFKCKCFKGFEGDGTRGSCKNIDECAQEPPVCDLATETCKDTSPGYECNCRGGFMKDPVTGKKCVDINECETGFAKCNRYAICKNTIGSYSCFCDVADNYKEVAVNASGPVCMPIDQCVEGRNGNKNLRACPDPHHHCRADGNKVTCTCEKGYRANGQMCINIDECRDEQMNACGIRTSRCKDTDGSYICECLPGFKLPAGVKPEEAKMCEDINECDLTPKPFCYPNSVCKNTFGGYICQCIDGFEAYGINTSASFPNCVPKNPCTKINPCYGGDCIYDKTKAPYFTCRCNDGLAAYNGTTCIDSKYCDTTDAFTCPPDAQCLSKTCRCNPGYKWMDVPPPVTIDKIKLRKCEPIDWCATYKTLECDKMKCKNYVKGTGSCYCDPGFIAIPELGNRRCEDLDECIIGNYSCNPHSHCVNSAGSYYCECDDGYYPVQDSNPDKPQCQNLDECLYHLDNCTAYKNTYCKDTDGSFKCDCVTGYKRDQIGGSDEGLLSYRDCIKTDPCSPNPCDTVARCDNSSGCAICVCPAGYFGEGTKEKSCRDKDECALKQDNCTEGIERCNNLVPGYECLCVTGFRKRNGKCEDINECKETPTICADPKTKVCENTIGSYVCKCLPGFIDLGNGTCIDQNECSTEICGPAPANKCNNTIGSYTCYCEKGYSKPCKDINCPNKCQNIDECKLDNMCGPNAACVDTEGSYLCVCKSAFYSGNPYDMKVGCTYNDSCSRMPCKKENAHCVSINEQKNECICNTGFIDVDGICRPDPCKNEMKCVGGICRSRPFGNKLVSDCICPTNMTWQNSTDKCIPDTICQCPDDQLSCTNSPTCKDPQVQTCVPRWGEAVCNCRPYLVFNAKTGKCDNQPQCITTENGPGKACPPKSDCFEVNDEFNRPKDRICVCKEKGMIWQPATLPDFAGKCIPDRECSKENYCQEMSNAYCDSAKGYCICNITGLFTLNITTGTCQKLDSCVNYRAQYKESRCKDPYAIEDGRGDICQCRCPSGFDEISEKNQTICNDKNECTAPNPPCLGNLSAPHCKNTIGSYMCICNEEKPYENFEVVNGVCQLKNLCPKTRICPPHSTCNLLNGKCDCDIGWRGEAPPGGIKDVVCPDENECLTSNPLCMQHATCSNTNGSFDCVCSPGFVRKSVVPYNISQVGMGILYKTFDFQCVDDDECARKPCAAHPNIKCTNTEGSYQCDCGQGFYQMTRFLCSVMTSTNCGGCSPHAECLRQVDSTTAINCSCVAGYEGNGKGPDGCKPIRYCDNVKQPPCDSNAVCTNLDPGFNCTCKPGYYGSGIGENGCRLKEFCVPSVNPCPRMSTCKEKLGKDRPKFEVGAKWSAKDFVDCICIEGYTFNREAFVCEDEDECKTKKIISPDHTPCPKLANCTNTQGSFTCICPAGYTYNSLTNECEDVNECATGEAEACKPGTGSCINTVGSWYCACSSGFRNSANNNQTCEYVDRCSIKTINPCNETTSTCYDAFESGFRCVCKKGYQTSPNNPLKCVDINECAFPNNCSSLTETCENFDGGFRCDCRAQYTREKGVCVPLIKCTEKCPDYSVCVLDRNNKTSCKCIDHYSWVDSNKTCSIIACNERDCGEGGKCVIVQNRNDSIQNDMLPYRCECDTGYFLDQATKLCKRGTPQVCNNSECGIGTCKPANNKEGYTCVCPGTDCFPTCTKDLCDSKAECRTAVRDNKTVLAYCKCKDGYRGFGTKAAGCFPITTCDERLCSKWAACKLVDGKSICVCDSHYTGNGTYCVDFDECAAKTDNCDVNADCMNIQGGFVCTCKPGYSGSGTKGNCYDINECDRSSGAVMNCVTPSTSCVNTNGSYYCVCNDGYENVTYPFTFCKDINECLNKSTCGIHDCMNVDPEQKYKCICKMGYKADPGEHSCSDVDECAQNLADCDKINGHCLNTIGSFTCQCNEGFTGDGRKCTVIDKCAKPSGNNCDLKTTSCVMVPSKADFLCKCKSGYQKPAGQSVVRSCDDIDECLNSTLYDSTTASCNNTDGGYQLGCKPGYTNLHKNALGTAACGALDECAQDLAYAETIKVIAKGNVKPADWKTWMVPPKDNTSGYALCYNAAMAGRIFSGQSLPNCKNLEPTTPMSKFSTATGWTYPTGYTCACSDGTADAVAGGIPRIQCSNQICNCPDPLMCSPSGQCVCKDATAKLRTTNGKITCSNVECDSGYTLPEKLIGTPEAQNIFCINNNFVAKAGYILVRDNVTKEVIGVEDIDECAAKTDPCCVGNCTGDYCVKCTNTIGSYTCAFMREGKNLLCDQSNIDKNKCECNKIACSQNEAWYWSCLRGFNVTNDPCLDDPKYKQPVCSKIYINNTFLTFPSLKDFYIRLAQFDTRNQNPFACFYDKFNADLSTSPLFNYFGACDRDSAKVSCPGGAKPTRNLVVDKTWPFCPARFTPTSPTPAIGQPITINYSTPPQCQNEFVNEFKAGYAFYYSIDGTESFDAAYPQ